MLFSFGCELLFLNGVAGPLGCLAVSFLHIISLNQW